jgi:hypothetical protein
MNTVNDYKDIEESWDENGFMGKLRNGIFDREAYNNLRDALLKLQPFDYTYFDKYFVSLVWFIPIYIGRQKQYIGSISSIEYDALKEELEELIAGIFGYP